MPACDGRAADDRLRPSGTTTTTINTSISGATTTDPQITVSWNADPGSVDGYALYFGPTDGDVSNLYGSYAVGSGAVDPAAPSVTLDAYTDLGLHSGDQAYNNVGTSAGSVPVCITLN